MKKRPDTSVTGLALMALIAAITGCNEELDDTAGQTPTLNWDAPMNRADGTKLYPGEIQGYRVYYRRTEESDFQTYFIDSPNQTSWTPTPLGSGTYRFAVSTIDTSGLESPRSETLRVTIP